jgi:GNAT superfamily N-acetyltransferase
MTSQRTLPTITFRDLSPDDYPRFIEIYNANHPEEPISASELRAYDESLDRSRYVLKRFAALSETGKIVGFGQIRHFLDMYHPKKFGIGIYVDPGEYCKGIGTATYQKLMKELTNLDATVAWTWCMEHLPKQQEFYLHRGFNEVVRAWESRLDPKDVDTGKLQNYVENALRQGITFTTLGEEQKRGRSLRGLYELVQLITADMPRAGSTFTPISYVQWQTLTFNSPRLLPEGYIIAKHGDEHVGVSIVFKNETEPKILSQDDTGVRREYRGRGIAIALKVKIIEFAKKHGYEIIRTGNDSSNVPMLAINDKLGFKKHTGWIRMERILRSVPHPRPRHLIT